MKILFLTTYFYETSVKTAILSDQELHGYFSDYQYDSELPDDTPNIPAFTVYGVMEVDEENQTMYQRTMPTPIILPFNPSDSSIFDNSVNDVLELSLELLQEAKNEAKDTELEGDYKISSTTD